MFEFKLNEEHEIVMCLIMLCKMTKNTDPFAHQQYLLHLRAMEQKMMKEFNDEDVGNNSFN